MNGPALVLAGPGSGKTTVLTHRVKYLVDSGIPPQTILVVTFTRAAAGEMERRFRAIGTHCGEGVTFSTCHALFFRILRQEYGYTREDILNEAQSLRILRDILRRYGMDTGEDTLRYVASDISRVKNTLLPREMTRQTAGVRDMSEDPLSDPQNEALADLPAGALPYQPVGILSDQSAASEPDPQAGSDQDPFCVNWCAPETFRQIYDSYNEALRRGRRIGFDDMQNLCLSLFARSPGALARWQSVWSYFLIDEFQDINPVQNRLLCLLSQPRDHFFVVGDEDQSIYAFRGASPRLILDFPKDHPGAAVYSLGTNYRCSDPIIRSAGQLIGENRLRTAKQIRGTGRNGPLPQVVCVQGQQEEAQMIAGDLRQRFTDGEDPSRIAVLYRGRMTEPYLTRALSSLMIPYRTKTRERDLYDHWITKDLFAYFTLSRERGSRTDLLRILNRPERGLPREVFTRASIGGADWREYLRILTPPEAAALRKLQKDLDRVARYRPYAALHYIIEGIGYGEVLKAHAERMKIPEEELFSVTEFLYEEAAAFESFADWKGEIRLRRERALQMAREKKEGVLLSTIHGAKGLEFDTVYLTDLSEGILPPGNALSQAQLEEERRLCYVAMTRAKKELKLYTIGRFHAHEVSPSRFLTEAGLIGESSANGD